MLDLGLSDEQEQLRDAFRSLFERECSTEVVREAEPLGFRAELWDRVRELGIVDMAVPESAGGAGATMLDAAIVCEVAGAALAPVPIVEAVVTARLLAALGTPAAAALLDDAIAGRALVTVALRPPDSAGRCRWVPAGAVADRVLVLDGNRIVAAGGAVPGTGTTNLGALPVADRHLTPADEVIAEGRDAVDAFERAQSEWRILTAALLCGAGRRSIDIAVAYTTERRQFGVQIASFQTIAHRLADAHTAMDGAQLLLYKAAWAADDDPENALALATMAFAYVAESAEHAVTEALHFHGGYGFMLEYDIQLYFRRIKAWSLVQGDRQVELRRLADTLWGPAASGDMHHSAPTSSAY